MTTPDLRDPFKVNVRFIQCRIDNKDLEQERPIRQEILSHEALYQLARTLGKRYKVSFKPQKGADLLREFNKHTQTLKNDYLLLAEAEDEKTPLPTGSEWIIDNYPLLEQHIAEVKRFLKGKLNKKLPKIDEGPYKGYPRIYLYTYELLQNTDATADKEVLNQFIHSSQYVEPLTIRELWAFPIMFRMVLFATLASLAEFNVVTKKQSERTEKVIAEIFSTPQKNSSEAILALAKEMDKNPDLWSAGCTFYLLQKLKERGSSGALCVEWLNQKIIEMGCNPQTIVSDVLYLLTANQISISHVFGLFRKISIQNWDDWFEEVSLLHGVLKQDPSGVYEKSSFVTRNRCRNRIEFLSKKTEENEVEIGKKLIAFTKEKRASLENGHAEIYGSVCYYLIDEGYEIFEKYINAPVNVLQKIVRWIQKNAFPIWLSTFFVFVFVITALPIYFLALHGEGWLRLGSMALVLSILSSEVSFQLIQWLVFHLKAPTPLAKLSRDEAPKMEYLTLVAVQTIFKSRENIHELVDQLEIHCLSNNEPNIYFAIIADLVDSKEKELAEDKDLICYAEQLVNRLNQHLPKFFLITRERRWCPTQQLFLGWERKRGKIHQLNQLILGKKPEGVHLNCGEIDILRSVKYVITLDEDTVIPPGNAAKLIATIAHPLNQAIFIPNSGKIERGYAIIQPSLDAPFGKSLLSRFSNIFAEAPGTDPYSRLISNINQDLFNVGTYVGKGIYNVEAFEKALGGWIPDGKILSHDLLEGSFARAGLASDINLLDSFPLSFYSFAKRLNRWTRGDWQLLSWLFSKIPNGKLERVPSPLSLLRRWQLLDNLRRSLVYPTAFFVLIGGFSFLPGNPLLWVMIVFFSINLPFITTLMDAVFAPIYKPKFIMQTYYRISHQLIKQFIQSFLRFAFLPALAFIQIKAILITLYRVFISHKDLLEWTSTATIESNEHTLKTEVMEMLYPIIITLGIYIFLGIIYPEEFLTVLPFLFLWIISPWLSYYFSLPPTQKIVKLDKKSKKKLLGLAKDTWRFFDELITEKSSFLVPDNLQMVPLPVVALRTSPTNIGFQFLCTLSAYDFGFIYAPDMLNRLEKAFNSMDKLEKYKGHLYNWYNIENLRPLHPRYVSTVDSGNLICSCITLRTALKDLNNDLIFTQNHWNQILEILDEVEHQITKSMPTKMDTLSNRLYSIKQLVKKLPFHPQKEHFAKELDKLIDNRALKAILQVCDCLEDVRKSILEHNIEDKIKKPILDEVTNILRTPIPTWKEAHLYSERIITLIHQLEPIVQLLVKGEKSQKTIDCINSLKKNSKEFHEIVLMTNSMSHILIQKITQLVDETDFSFLYSPREELLTIGYQVENNVLDSNFYTFLASESCLTSLVAIAKGDVETKHWFALGRQLVKTSGGKALLSWSGSIFEYLMPFILINPLPNSLMRQSYITCVKAQEHYGKTRKLPWGISESGYGITDLEGNYQYRGFGIPELGLKRGLHEDLVISPYSTILALPFDPWGALKNIDYLEKEGARGTYGFYESIDYTPRRLAKNEKSYILESHLGHHQGMIFTTLNNFLNDGILQKRFQGCAHIEAFSALLEEQFPFHGPSLTLLQPKPHTYSKAMRVKRVPKERYVLSPHTLFPDTHVLSNGKMSEMIDNAGSGYLFYKRNIALTRWKENAIGNDKGYYIYIRDLDSNEVWSVGYQPTRVDSNKYEVIYSTEKVTIIRKDFDIGLTCEITISPDHNAEIRKLTFRNESRKKRRLEITSYGEVTLTNLFSDINHPSFSNMFVESEFNQQYDALIFRRIPRGHDEKEIFLSHMIVYSVCWSRLQWNTNRRNFIGRNKSVHNPDGMISSMPLSGGDKRTLDPIFSLRPIIELDIGAVESISFVTATAETRDELFNIIQSFYSLDAVSRAFEMSLARSNVEVRYEQVPIEKIHIYQEFSKAIFFHLDPLKFSIEARNNNKLQQDSLWRFGISGDFPIVLVKLTEQKQLSLVKDLMICHQYLDRRGLNYDLVILNEVIEGYRAEFQDELVNLITLTASGAKSNGEQKRGNIYILKRQEMSKDEENLLTALAQECYTDKDEKIVKLLNAPIENLSLPLRERVIFPKIDPSEYSKVMFYNGYGGFIEDGKAYRIFTEPNRVCPHPWSNVIGSKEFGFLVTETGGGYTWSENAQENRLTPWNPDPVTDPKEEMIYVRDYSSKEFFSVCSPPSIVENHFGYTTFNTVRGDIQTDLIISSSLDKKVKWWKLNIKNESLKTKQLEVYLYVDWMLGVFPMKNKSQLLTEFDSKFQIIAAKNNYNSSFSGRTAFIGSSEIIHSYTTSRREFVGRNLTTSLPLALTADTKIAPLKNQISSGMDSVGVIHLVLQIPPEQDKDVLFFLGEENTLQQAREASISYKSFATWKSEWESVKEFWKQTTSKIEVKTEDPSFDIMMNGWLIYQTLACRIFAKTGYYQCSGAIGYRDQLQDSMALLTIDPSRTRNQLLLHASRQFVEGDVQHWWSPQSGKGVRTRFSDDYLWLPYCLLRYLEVTGDFTILDEVVPYLEGEQLKDDQQEIYFQPKVSSKKDSVYDHCILMLEKALKFGSHGLPLMGCGDWNDGMNEVGVKGKGESVWLGWFLYNILNRFSKISEMRNDVQRANKYQSAAEELLNNIEQNAWDGDWYRRAYFDDGTPLGSKLNDACEIDSLSQSWSVISKGGKKERQHKSIESAIQHLVKSDSKVICLLTPPFGDTKLEPGYIKSYPPGVRENGAQYTHAASWLILASAMLGKGNQTYDLFKMINPINHTLDKQGVEKYRGEPYVVAGDVYSEPPFAGRVGWSWYTGAAGWLYNVALEGILGFRIRNNQLILEPCIPSSWTEFSIKYQRGNILYDIRISNPNHVEHGVKQVVIDGKISENKIVELLPETSEQPERTIVVEVLMG